VSGLYPADATAARAKSGPKGDNIGQGPLAAGGPADR
jgi:hypothetical protein